MVAETKVKVEVRYVPPARVLEIYGKVSLGLPDAFLPPGDLQLIDVCTLKLHMRPANHPANLDTMYRSYQSVDRTPDERTTQLDERSMTKGDAFIIDGHAYYVVDDGFVSRNDLGSWEAVTEENHKKFAS